MKILAIWERPQADPKWGGTFCLLASGELLYVAQGRDFAGTDAVGNRVYTETGIADWSPAFKAKEK